MEFAMIRSIRETPRALSSAWKALKEWDTPQREFRRVVFIGCGSSYFSSLAGNHILLGASTMESHALPASEFVFHYRKLARNAFVVASSRSGMTGEVVEALKVAKGEGAVTLGVTCNENSKIEEVADFVVVLEHCEEPNVPATKSFSAITYFLQGMAIEFLDDAVDMLGELRAVMSAVKDTLAHEREYARIAEGLVQKDAFVHLGSGAGYVVALEGALKFRETLGVPSEVFPALEFRHGPVALLRGTAEVQPIVIVPKGDSANFLERLVDDIASVGVRPLVITNLGVARGRLEVAWRGSEELAVVPFAVPLQVLSYYLAVMRGRNPDFPEGLVKVVERF